MLGTLYGRDGVPVGTVQVKVGKVNKKKGTVKISATATLLADGKLKKFTVKVIGLVVDGKGWGSATGPGGVSFAVTVE